MGARTFCKGARKGRKHARVSTPEREIKRSCILFNPANMACHHQGKDSDRGVKREDAADSLHGTG